MIDRFGSDVVRVAGALIVAVVIGVLLGRPEAPVDPAVSIDPPSASEPAATDVLVVHISGEVASAGLVELTGPARVADVIAAAGGVTPAADLHRVNLAESVVDGQQIVVPSGSSPDSYPVDVRDGTGRVRINDADAAALEALPGIGPVLAGTIVAHRSEYGPFLAVEDLLDVPGIGEQKLASLRDLVIVP